VSDELARKRALLTSEKRALLKQRLAGLGAVAEVPIAVRAAPVVSFEGDMSSLDVPFDVFVEAARARMAELPAGLTSFGFHSLAHAFNALAIAAMAKALRELGAFAEAGARCTVDSLVRDAGVAAQHRKLLGRWLLTLAERGLLERHGEEFVAPCALDAAVPPAVVAAAMAAADGTDYAPVAHAIVTVVGDLAGVVRGDHDALETFFGGSSRVVDVAYGETREARFVLDGAAAFVQALVAHTLPARPLRVIELGGGIGATTRRLVPLLGEGAWTYVFTDLSSYFFDDAERLFGGAPRMHYARVDIDEPLSEARLVEHQFDLVVAANVLHCARFVRRSLSLARSLLKPGGVLLLVEASANETWHQITMGLLKGFMSFEDGRSERQLPLLARSEWVSALERAGFRAVAALPESERDGALVGQHLFAARA
jgi:SAM-dependent methyltransferase